MDAEGERSLEPAVVFGFSMPEVGDGDRSSSFAFVLPGGGRRQGRHHTRPPGGSFVLDGDTIPSRAHPARSKHRRSPGYLRDVSPPDGTARSLKWTATVSTDASAAACRRKRLHSVKSRGCSPPQRTLTWPCGQGRQQTQQLPPPDHLLSALQGRPHIGHERIPRQSRHSPRTHLR